MPPRRNRGYGQSLVHVHHLEADVVDLVALRIFGLGILEHLDMRVAAGIEIVAEDAPSRVKLNTFSKPSTRAYHSAVASMSLAKMQTWAILRMIFCFMISNSSNSLIRV